MEEVFLAPPTPAALPGLLDAWGEFAKGLTRRDDNPVPPAVASFLFVYQVQAACAHREKDLARVHHRGAQALAHAGTVR